MIYFQEDLPASKSTTLYSTE